MSAPKYKGNPILTQIVNRCHVSHSNVRVGLYVISCLREKGKTFRALPKRERKAFLKEAFRVHAENQKLFRYVVTEYGLKGRSFQ